MLADVLRRYYKMCSELQRRLEADGFCGLTPEQAIALYLMGDRQLSIKQLRDECYFGTNPTYTVRRLSELGFIKVEPDVEDRRSSLLQATATARKVCEIVRQMEK